MGVQKHGTKFGAISAMIPNRSSTHIRDKHRSMVKNGLFWKLEKALGIKKGGDGENGGAGSQ